MLADCLLRKRWSGWVTDWWYVDALRRSVRPMLIAHAGGLSFFQGVEGPACDGVINHEVAPITLLLYMPR